MEEQLGASVRPEPIPVPGADNQDPNRLWIGNLDAQITEFSLLKVLQSYGTLEKYDFLYHKNGPEKGLPRGYCFATYANRRQAERAQNSLNGKKLFAKRVFVKWAHEQKDIAPERKKVTILGTGTELSSGGKADVDPQSAIKAIEAKLQFMERNPEIAVPQPARVKSGSCTRNDSARKHDLTNRRKPYTTSTKAQKSTRS